MPLAFEIYGAASNTAESLIKSLVNRAALLNKIPFSVLLSYWRRRMSTTSLQFYNSWIIEQAYLKINNQGGGNMGRDFTVERIV